MNQRGRDSLFILDDHKETDQPPRDTQATVGGSCSLAHAKQTAFPLAAGGDNASGRGLHEARYAVLILIGVGMED
ncbi:MAG: hypothetical protein HOO98_19250 [Nitrospira sp.]|nr:hypothetical protein [Nitrospira sp.]